MANVVTLPDYGTNAIQQFVQSLSANRDRDQQRDYQTKSLGIQQQQVDQSGQADQARIQQAQDAARSGDVSAQAAVIQKGLDNLTKAGPDGIAQAKKILEAVRQAKPAVGQHLFVQDDPTNADLATGNANKYAADATGRVAAGGQDAQDRNLTTKVATDAFLPAEAFKDQVQRDPRAADATTPYGQGAAIASGRKADAGDVLQAQTSRANNSANIEANAPVRAAQVANYNSEIGARASVQATADRTELVRGDPTKASSDAKLLASYKLNPRSLDRMKPDAKRALLDEALILNPKLDLTNYDANVKIRVEFAGGQAAKNIKNLNTAILHLEEWYNKVGKLNNTFNPSLNSTMNAVSEGFGGGRPGAAVSAGHTVASEYAALKKGGVPDKAEIEAENKTFAANSSPNKRDEIRDTVGHAMLDRAAALVNQRRAVELPDDQPILSEAARKALGRMGLDPAKVMPDVQWAPEKASPPDKASGAFAGATAGGPAAAGAAPITTPDGKHWRKNPDGSMTEVP